MSRPLRLQFPGAVYHVTARGNAREAIFFGDADRSLFLQTLGEAIERFRWRCHAYCLMNNHYHLLLETADANLSLGMRHLICRTKSAAIASAFSPRYAVTKKQTFGDCSCDSVARPPLYPREPMRAAEQSQTRRGVSGEHCRTSDAIDVPYKLPRRSSFSVRRRIVSCAACRALSSSAGTPCLSSSNTSNSTISMAANWACTGQGHG